MHDLPPGTRVFERGWLSANNILFTGRHGTAMVDSGYCTHSGQTVALVQQHLSAKPLDILLNTHLHSDHCGGNAALQVAFPSLRTGIPPGHANFVQHWDPVRLSYEPTGQLCPPFHFDFLLKPGDQIQLGDLSWQIHAAPGHDPHSILLFQPQFRTLISADALWEKGFGVVFPEIEGLRAFDEVAATLDLIESLAPLSVIPGHGAVFHQLADSLAVARRRLDDFVRHPQKHASHAGKVLLKFKLLELQRVQFSEFLIWAAHMTHMKSLHRIYFQHMEFGAWVTQLCDELVKTSAARRAGSLILNA